MEICECLHTNQGSVAKFQGKQLICKFNFGHLVNWTKSPKSWEPMHQICWEKFFKVFYESDLRQSAFLFQIHLQIICQNHLLESRSCLKCHLICSECWRHSSNNQYSVFHSWLASFWFSHLKKWKLSKNLKMNQVILDCFVIGLCNKTFSCVYLFSEKVLVVNISANVVLLDLYVERTKIVQIFWVEKLS